MEKFIKIAGFLLFTCTAFLMVYISSFTGPEDTQRSFIGMFLFSLILFGPPLILGLHSFYIRWLNSKKANRNTIFAMALAVLVGILTLKLSITGEAQSGIVAFYLPLGFVSFAICSLLAFFGTKHTAR